jgi:hypothetical protein
VTAVKSAGGSPFSGLEAPLHQEDVLGAPAGYAWLYPTLFCAMTLEARLTEVTASGLPLAASALSVETARIPMRPSDRSQPEADRSRTLRAIAAGGEQDGTKWQVSDMDRPITS